jgi:hypothetical protein
MPHAVTVFIVRLLSVGAAAAALSGCTPVSLGSQSADERWGDHVCTAMGDWSVARGEIGADMITWRDEGHWTPERMVSALRGGLAANQRLKRAVGDAGPAPVSDGAWLYAKLNEMVGAGTAHVRRAYRIALAAEASHTDAYLQVQEQLLLADHAFDDRGVIISRWYGIQSCRDNT